MVSVHSMRSHVNYNSGTSKSCAGYIYPAHDFHVQGGSNMTGTCAACLHTNQSRSYFNHLVPPL